MHQSPVSILSVACRFTLSTISQFITLESQEVPKFMNHVSPLSLSISGDSVGTITLALPPPHAEQLSPISLLQTSKSPRNSGEERRARLALRDQLLSYDVGIQCWFLEGSVLWKRSGARQGGETEKNSGRGRKNVRDTIFFIYFFVIQFYICFFFVPI